MIEFTHFSYWQPHENIAWTTWTSKFPNLETNGETWHGVNRIHRIFPLYGVCEGCVIRNHYQYLVESGKEWGEKYSLELVHSDLYYMNIPSMVGARNILIFIDDFPRNTWVYFSKIKFHVFENFKEFSYLFPLILCMHH